MKKKRATDISIIDASLQVEGTISGKGKLVIQGALNGTLTAVEVIVAEGGRVSADVTADDFGISGTYEGNAEVSGTLTIYPTGRVSGKIRCGNMMVEPGGILDADVSSSTPAAPQDQDNAS